MHVEQKVKDSKQTSNRVTSTASLIAQHPLFFRIVITLILLNGVIIGLETYPVIYEPYKAWFYAADRVLLWLFTIEIIIRFVAARPTSQYFKDGWNIFDFLIVACGHLFTGASFITVLRVFRILRVLRAISIIPSLKKMVNALLLTIPALGSIMLLMGIIAYIFAVIGTLLFSSIAPQYFGSLHESLLTLFEIVTLDAWTTTARFIIGEAPWAWIYFIVFILVGTFVIFNLFVGVIVGNVEKANQQEQEVEKRNSELLLKEEIHALRSELAEIKAMLQNKDHR